LQSVGFVQVFQSGLSHDSVFALPFVHICGLSAGFQRVMMIISLVQFMDFIPCS